MVNVKKTEVLQQATSCIVVIIFSLLQNKKLLCGTLQFCIVVFTFFVTNYLSYVLTIHWFT